MMCELRFAMRQLVKSPGFTATVVLTLALGIGANTAIFTMFDQVLLRMLPVQSPKELVRLEWSGSYSGSMSSFGGDSPGHSNYYSYPMYKDLRDQNSVFQGVFAADRTQLGISWHNRPGAKIPRSLAGTTSRYWASGRPPGACLRSRTKPQRTPMP